MLFLQHVSLVPRLALKSEHKSTCIPERGRLGTRDVKLMEQSTTSLSYVRGNVSENGAVMSSIV